LWEKTEKEMIATSIRKTAEERSAALIRPVHQNAEMLFIGKGGLRKQTKKVEREEWIGALGEGKRGGGRKSGAVQLIPKPTITGADIGKGN